MFGRDRVGVFARRNSAPVVMLGQVKIFLFAFFSCLVNVWLFVCVCVFCVIEVFGNMCSVLSLQCSVSEISVNTR